MRNICIIGSGYVGLVTGACFAELGNNIIFVDNDKKKINNLKKSIVPIYEPGLEDLLKKNRKKIKFTTSIREGVINSEITFITVGTPPDKDGSADLSSIERVALEIASSLSSSKLSGKLNLIVEKSTVPVETGERVKMTIERNITKKVPFEVASNPEFLREGQAIHDFFNPDRIVIGVETKKAEKVLKELYSPINAPVVVTDIKSAELIKHASNSFLATKISFINAVANICELVGADVTKVAEGMGLDRRIGREFLNAGPGYGGSCFPKDIDAFYKISKKLGYEFTLLDEVKKINENQKKSIVKKIENLLWVINGKTIAVMGIAFKPDTDDIRMSPSIDIIKMLIEKGAKVKIFDPKAMEKAKEILKNVVYCKDLYEAARNSDCVVFMTEWKEFKKVDFKKLKEIMKQHFFVDARNMFSPDEVKNCGFIYKGVGR